MTTHKFFSIIVFSTLLLATAAAHAQTPIPTGKTPTLYGGERLTPGTFVMGATTGYPETSFDLYWGLAEVFDIALQAGFTYGAGIDGNRQRIGFDGHVPLRFTMIQKSKVSGGLRVAPYFMIGEGHPSMAFGGDVAFLIDIALPKIFKIIVGPEIRTGFATLGNKNDNGTRASGYDGGAWANIGLETLIQNKWHVGLVFHGGGQWGSGGLNEDGTFRANLYFGGTL